MDMSEQPSPSHYCSLGSSLSLSRQQIDLQWYSTPSNSGHASGRSYDVAVDINDGKRAVVFSLIVEIDHNVNHSNMTPCGKWTAGSTTTPMFRDITLSCVGRRPKCHPFDKAWDMAMENLHTFQAKIRKYPEASTMQSFEMDDGGLKFRHKLFEPIGGWRESRLEELGHEFTFKGWPHETPDAGEELNKLTNAGTHKIVPLAAYNKKGDLIKPEEYGRQLPGATARMDFILKHTALDKGRQHDVFEAFVWCIKLIEPPHPTISLERPSLKRRYTEYISADNTAVENHVEGREAKKERVDSEAPRPDPMGSSFEFELQNPSFLETCFRNGLLAWVKDSYNDKHHTLERKDTKEQAVLQGIFQVSADSPHQRLNAAMVWKHDSKQNTTHAVDKMKRSCVVERPTAAPYDGQFDTVKSNIHAILEDVRQYSGWDRFESRDQPAFTFRHPAFLRENPELRRSYDKLDPSLKDDHFFCDVDNKISDGFRAAIQKFVVELLPLFDEGGQLVKPQDYLSKLLGATVRLSFTLEHYAFDSRDAAPSGSSSSSSTGYDTFTATIQSIHIISPPSPGHSPTKHKRTSMIEQMSQ